MTKNLTDFTAEQLKDYLSTNLPPIIAREKVSDYLGGLIASSSLQKYDCLGLGPKQLPKAENDRKVAYLRPDFIAWFINRIYQDEKEITNDD